MTTTNPLQMRIPGKSWEELQLESNGHLFLLKPWEPALTQEETKMPKDYDPWKTGKAILTTEGRLQQQASSPENPHPNIQIAYGIGDYGTEIDGLDHALKLQRITGKKLTQILEFGGQPEDPLQRTLIKILAQIANAVQHCHTKGVVHCGLTPYNITIETEGEGTEEKPTGRYYLTNFSLAHEIGDAKQTPSGIQESDTGFGAPEFTRGHPITTVTDTYDFARTAYLALTGIFPRKGATVQQLKKHTTSLGGELEDILVDGQNENPSNRPSFETVAEVLTNYAALIERAEELKLTEYLK